MVFNMATWGKGGTERRRGERMRGRGGGLIFGQCHKHEMKKL